jgi:hypothetical protein
MKYATSSRLFGLVVFLAFSAVTALAQGGSTGSLSGTVSDPQGAAVAGATITATNSATNASRTTSSTNDGLYQLPQLPPGTYRVRAEAKGFASLVQENVTVAVDTAVTLKLQFTQLGTVNETVTVQGGESAINTSDATVGNAFNERQIRQLPLEGRNVVSLLAAQPGVVFIGNTNAQGNTSDDRNGSVNGGKSDQANVTLDGVDVNDQQNGFAFRSVLRVTLDSVQEFRVTTTNPNADQGRSSGAQVSLVTRGGSNQYRGSLYEFHRNTITTANDFFNNATGRYTAEDLAVQVGQARVGDERAPRPKLIRNIFGGTLGGPVIKDRLFFFLNYEGRRDRREDNAVRNVPSLEMRQGILKFRNTSGQVITLSPAQIKALDPAGIGINANSLAVLQRYPAPNDTTVGDGFNLLGYRFSAPVKLDFNTYITRLDYQLTGDGRHTLFWRGNLQNDDFNAVPQFPGQAPLARTLENSKGFATGYTAALTNNLTNVFRYGFTRQGIDVLGAATARETVTFRSIAAIEPLTRSAGRIVPVNNFIDDLTWVKGGHTFGFGTNIRFIRNNRYDFGNSFNCAITNASWLLGTGADLRPAGIASTLRVSFTDAMMALLGIVSFGTANYNYDRTGRLAPVGEVIERRFAADEYEWYGQDAWRMRPNLTLTAGLRYGLYSPPWETNGNQVKPTISLGAWFNQRGANGQQGVPSNAAPPIRFDLSGPVNGRTGFYEWDKNNFAPRFAFAYAPKLENKLARLLFGAGQTALRGGFSLAYDRIGGGLAVTFDQAGSFGLQTALNNPSSGLTSVTAPRFSAFDKIPAGLLPLPPASSAFPRTFPGAGENGSFAITHGLDDTIVTPYSMSVNFSVQRELPKQMSLEVAYIGRFGRKLLIQSDLAQPVDLFDSVSGVSYYNAAKQLLALGDRNLRDVPKLPYWENLFGNTLKGITVGDMATFYSSFIRTANPGLTNADQLTATQVAYFLYKQWYAPDYTSALYDLDTGFGSKFGTYAYFNDQFSALSAWRSIAQSSFNSLQVILRKRFSDGLQADFNYTLGKSFDWSSGTERNGAFGGGFVVNSWQPGQRRAVSDFDLRHSINANYIWELPFGKGQWLGRNLNRTADAVVGGWQLSGIFRWTSGLPIGVGNGRFWPTNWNITGFATRTGPLPKLQRTKNAPAAGAGGTPGPNLFADPAKALESYENTLVGETGERNGLRGDGFFGLDFGLGKSWRLPWEGHRVQFRWEVFNATNTVRFDVNSLTLDLGSGAANFGKYSATLTNPRVMQFALRYEF